MTGPPSPPLNDITMTPPEPGEATAWLESLPVPALMVDNRTRARWGNAAARAWWPDAAHLPRPLSSLVGLEPEQVDTALWEQGPALRDWALSPDGGSPVTCRVAISPLPNGGRLLLLTPVEDLQHQARKASALAERLEAAQEFGRIGVWERNLHTMEARWDRHLLAFWGRGPTDPAPSLEEALLSVVDEDREALRSAWHDAMRQPGLYTQRFRVRRPDGTLARLESHWVVKAGEDGRPAHAVGVMVDDTQAWEVGQAHDDARRQLAAAVDLAGISLTTHDLRARIVYLNRTGWKFLGLPERPEGLPMAEGEKLIHPEDRGPLAESFAAAQASDQPQDFELRLRRSDGTWRTLMGRRFAMRDAQGTVVALNDVGMDITEIRAAATARSAALAAERELQAKARFLSRMSHELRTPLNGILGFTRLMQADGARIDEATRQDRLAHIETAGRHLLALLDDILDLSRVEGGEMRVQRIPVALRPQVQQVLTLAEPLARQFGVSLELGALDEVAMADETRLRQVLLNLVTNAIKYNRPQGRVRLEAQIEDDRVVLSVADTGRGLSAEQLERLFEPFDRLGAEATEVEGTGIGLTIVKGLVERMAGTIQVRSELEVGTTFEIRLWGADLATRTLVLAAPLPSVAAPVERPLVAAGWAASVSTTGEVLYIEDNPVNTMIVGELVRRREGLTMLSADTGNAGVALALAQLPALILLDMQLPDIDGLEVFRRLRADVRTAHIPCIALSAEAHESDIQRALDAGFTGYLTKPVDFEAFDRALDDIFQGASCQHIDLPAGDAP